MLKLFAVVLILAFVEKSTLAIDLLAAETCDPMQCKPPNCRCASTILDDKIPEAQIPQVGYYNNLTDK